MKKMSKSTNILLWIFQILLALYFLAGGIYMIGHYQLIATAWALQTVPQPIWMALGALQVLFALGLVLTVKIVSRQLFISAVGLIVISLLGIVLYAMYAGMGMLWAVVPAILLAFVVYGRRTR
jgi:hypothetical protein